MASLADLVVNIGANTDDLESSLGDTASFIDDNIGKITALGAAAGAALEGFARSQQDTNVALERMGRVTGEGSDAMRDMAGNLQNATFPMSDVVNLMETATQRGLEGDAIAEYATFWDKVGDATGEAGPALGKAGVALGLVGIKAGEEAQALDAFGYITDNTTGSIEGFLGFIEKTAAELGDSTPNVNDMAAALGALEESGLSSQRAQRELRTALSETDGDMMAALETLGVSEEAYRSQVGAVEASSGAIDANAQAYADSFTPMQKMQAQAEKLMTKYGSLADVAGSLAVPLMALGPVMKGVSSVWKSAGATKVAAMAKTTAATVKSTATIVAKWLWTGVQSLLHAGKVAAAWLLAMGPIALVIAAVVGLSVVIAKNWDKIKKVIAAGWDWVKDKTAALWGWVKSATSSAVSAVVGFFTGLRDKAVATFQNLRATVVGIATGVRSKVVSIFTGLRDSVVGKIRSLMGRIRSIKDFVLRFFSGAGRWLVNAGKNLVMGLVNGIKGSIGKAVNAVRGGIQKIRNLLPFSPAKDGPLSGRGAPDVAGAKIGEMLADGMRSQVGSVAAAGSTLAGAAVPGVPGVHPMAIGGDGAAAGRGEFNITVNNPAPEPASRSVSRQMRKLQSVGVFGE